MSTLSTHSEPVKPEIAGKIETQPEQDWEQDQIDYEPMPVSVIPQPVAQFIRQTAAAIGCDPSFVALPMFSALGAAIGNTRRIKIKRGWREPPIFWTGTIGPSGTGKSPAMTAALAPLYKIQSRALDRYADMRDLHETEIEDYEDRFSKWKQTKNPDTRPIKPQEPTPKRYLASDITVEALAAILADNPRGVLVANDELAAWLKSFDAYRGGRGGDAAKWLSLWQAGTIIVDRKASINGTIHVPMASAAVTGTIQPNVLRETMGRALIDNGCAARVLLASPPKRRRAWSEAEVSEVTLGKVDCLFEALLDLQFNHDSDGKPIPVDVPLSEDGRRAWVSWYDNWATIDAATVGDHAAVSAKMVSYCARFSLLFHLIRVVSQDKTLPDENAVDAGSVGCACQMVRWFQNEASRIYFDLTEGETEQRTRELIETIKANGGEITVRELIRSRSRYRNARQARDDLSGLSGMGLGSFVRVPSKNKGGRPSEVFTLPETYFDKTPKFGP